MKLNELLDEIKIGKENYEAEKLAEDVNKNFDSLMEQNNYSKIIKKLNNEILEESNGHEKIFPLFNSVKKLSIKLQSIEEKEEFSDIYKRMKTDSLIENVNEILSILESNVVKKLASKNKVSSIISLAESVLSELNEDKNFKAKLKDYPEYISEDIETKVNKIKG